MNEYLGFAVDSVPTSIESHLILDGFVHLPKAGRFVRWICKNECFEQRHFDKLKTHSDPKLYVSTKEWNKLFGESTHTPKLPFASKEFLINLLPKANGTSAAITMESPQGFSSDWVPSGDSKMAREPIRDQVWKLLTEGSPQQSLGLASIEDLRRMAPGILSLIGEDVLKLKAVLMRNSANQAVLENAELIATLSVAVAIAQSYSLRNVFRDLATACFIMDLSLSSLGTAIQKDVFCGTYSPSGNSVESKLVHEHPTRSQHLSRSRLRTLPEIVAQIVVGHHELCNGKGYPKGTRNELLAPLVRVVALGTDLSEKLQLMHLQNASITLQAATELCGDCGGQAHLRRHSKKILDDFNKLLCDPASKAA